MYYDPLRAALEIREQLASEKRRLSFFFGAGSSMAVGFPGIESLTDQVFSKIDQPYKNRFDNIRNELNKINNVEKILDRIRLYRELIGESEECQYAGIKGAKEAKALDLAVCHAIKDIVSVEPKGGLKPHLIFAQWLRTLHCNRNYPVEIFTTNYDLLFEKAMEQVGLPFFDGFIGSVAPFFIPESVEADESKEYKSVYPPRTWTRLWKVHGSINWFVQKEHSGDNKERITRFSGINQQARDELMIFPSREKYSQSRKLPFVALQDRLRRFILNGETLLIIIGYSFSDEHLNDIMLQGLRSNPRLAISAFMYEPLSEKISRYANEYRNLTLYSPDKICIGGLISSWGEPGRKRKDSEIWPFWDEEKKRFTLGDFNAFASFLEIFIGLRQLTEVCPIDFQQSSTSNTQN
ncbi:MAG: SIR2 family protein [Acetivibrionales bacterium]